MKKSCPSIPCLPLQHTRTPLSSSFTHSSGEPGSKLMLCDASLIYQLFPRHKVVDGRTRADAVGGGGTDGAGEEGKRGFCEFLLLFAPQKHALKALTYYEGGGGRFFVPNIFSDSAHKSAWASERNRMSLFSSWHRGSPDPRWRIFEN